MENKIVITKKDYEWLVKQLDLGRKNAYIICKLGEQVEELGGTYNCDSLKDQFDGAIWETTDPKDVFDNFVVRE